MASIEIQFIGWRRDGIFAASIPEQETKGRKSRAPGLQVGLPSPVRRAAARVQVVGRNGDDGRESRRASTRKYRRESDVVVALPQEAQEGNNDEIVELPISVDYISSPSSAYVKYLARLRQSAKTRNAIASVLVVGSVPLREICESVDEEKAPRRLLIDVLLVREDAEAPPPQGVIASSSRRVVRVSLAAMSKLSGLDSPPEVAGVLTFPPNFTCCVPYGDATVPSPVQQQQQQQMRKWCSSPRRILVLDAIQDPGNVGTLLRTAAAFAWDGVFLLHGCCDCFNDKALRAARGASFRVPIATGEWNHVRQFASANKLKLYAGDPNPGMAESSPFQLGPHSSIVEQGLEHDGEGLCLVLGSEGQGLSEDVSRDCSPIGIPMPGKFESLNVAVAGGILMFLLR